jgi:superfamily II DNA or RNA helicase
MPTIFDNIEKKFAEGIIQHIKNAKRVDYCVGYFNIRGWKTVCNHIETIEGMEIKENGKTYKRYCRLLVGMTKNPFDTLIDEINPDGSFIDNERASKMKRKLAEDFKKQLEIGIPTDDDERTIKQLLCQLKNGKVVVKLFMEYQLHAKLYLSYTDNSLTNNVALLGSSNFTFSGFQNQGELNVDVLEQDAAEKLSKWFNKRWNSRWCIDITKELIEVIENSWAREKDISPYHVYMKMAYHLSQEARSGISEFKLPREFQNELLDFQQKAVLIASQHLNKRNGVIVGDVVGLGKTITACAIAKIMEEDLLLNTLILCPKNLVGMWNNYIEKYGLHAHVVSHSMIISELPVLKRYRLVIIDESHNFRNSENKTYKAVKTYIEENESKVILLSATPYNKSYKDLASQLKLFIPEDYDIGIGPERYIEELGGTVQFHMKHDNLPVHSIGAFEKSTNPDDWRELMRLYLVRRTRSFIKNNYAYTDENNGRKYLEFSNGARSYFPNRQPKRVLFPMSQVDEKDQYAKLYDEDVVELIDQLALPRYSMIDYIDNKKAPKATTNELQVIENLSRAGHRTKGFCRTNLFKRLESCGYAFLQSVERLIIRNYIVYHAVKNGLPIPIGGNAVSVDFDESDMEYSEYYDKDNDADLFDKVTGETQKSYVKQAELMYEEISTRQKKRFQWVRAELFNMSKLMSDIEYDNEKLLSIVAKVGVWNPDEDRKVEALVSLLDKTHKNEKIIIFTQYSDTAQYLGNQLESKGVRGIGVATGSTVDISNLINRFSPVSNEYSVEKENELRVLISTDVLSEGQNLQDAHIVVNFDLPWALIRLVQRAGRVDRLGQKSEQIFCYSFLPEDGIEQIIGLRAKLKNRIQQNAEVVGSDEVFFDGDPINIADLYSEKSGILDEEDDGDVDLASYAYQIWKNAIDEHPELKIVIPTMSNVVYSTKRNTISADEDSVIVYSRTGQGNDVFSWIDKNGKVITQSQYTILKAVACDYNCQVEDRIINHHGLVKQAIDLISKDEYSGMGTLGRKTGIRYKAYMKISRYIEEHSDDIATINKYKRVLDEIYKYPLCERARDVLSRQLKAEVSDEEFSDAALMLKEDDRLIISGDSESEYKPTQIICSMGMRKVD